MVPGYVHFDCRRGLRVDLLNAALCSLLRDHARVNKVVDSLGIIGLSFFLSEQTIGSIRGHCLRFCVDGKFLEDDVATSLMTNIFSQNVISLTDLEQWLLQKTLAPAVSALAHKILAQLKTNDLAQHNLKASDAMWLVCHIVLFCALVDALDPKFITASKIYVSSQRSDKFLDTLSLTDTRWLNHLLINLPTVEVDDAIAIDVVAVACIKALAGQIGARGESRIHKIAVGITDASSLLTPTITEVFWCEPNLPESMSEHGFNNSARRDLLHSITGTIPATLDSLEIAASLSLHGAMSITWHLAQREKNSSCYVVRFLVRDEDKRDAVEAFLIKGAAFDVTSAIIERHELNKRLVSVPIGTGNKATTARFFEYLYLNKTVRAEPIKEDLDLYVQKTDYSVDVARSDLMLAWKKWRGRVVEDQ